ncbi:sortase [Actinomarinicola tropica]|uniref:Sortase n=1 Tax=Actinomarinicola tropica TaxID=2789776 RepID=A0A5Q2RHV8_9ACTN|nr:class E sortase [Actinomarinicola tropica]QGG96379.1 sortase [Actinomarinicola tropica]
MRLAPTRRLAAVVACAGALVAGGCTSAVIEDGAADAAFDEAPAATSSTTAVPLLDHGLDVEIERATAAPGLPVPEPLPTDPYAATPEVVLGRVSIPAIGLDDELHVGMTLTAINRGPSHWPGTALPGQVGNMVLAGHRTTYSRPFLDLDLVVPGDEMVVETTDGERHVYVAIHTEVVPEDAVWIADQTPERTATTFACHPKGSARERIVVRWRLVEPAGAPVAPPA